MCVDVDEPWETFFRDDHAEVPEGQKGSCYECGRDLVGVEHVREGCGPIAYRYCQIEGCLHEGDCNDGSEFIDMGEGAVMRFCLQCLAARVWLEKVCRSWMYGGVLEDLENHFVDEIRPIHSLPLGRIVVASKKRWRRRDGTLWSPEVVEGWANQGAALVAAAITGQGEGK